MIPGGGIGPDHDCWVECRPGFFLPVRVLSALFRRRFIEEMEKLHRQAKLTFFGDLLPLGDPQAFARFVEPLRETEWVVYAKPPFGGPQQVLEYLGRYTHRVAISNHRLVSADNGEVSFRWKDYRHDQRERTMTLSAAEFIRRDKLALLARLLKHPVTELLPLPKDCAALLALPANRHKDLCPHCGVGHLHCIAVLLPIRWQAPVIDSS